MNNLRTVLLTLLMATGLAVNQRSSADDAATNNKDSQAQKRLPELQESAAQRRKEVAVNAFLQQRKRIRWGESVNGLEMGVAGPNEGQCIPIGSTVRFTLLSAMPERKQFGSNTCGPRRASSLPQSLHR